MKLNLLAIDDPMLPMVALTPKHRPIELPRPPGHIPEAEDERFPVRQPTHRDLIDAFGDRGPLIEAKHGRGSAIVEAGEGLRVLFLARDGPREPIRPIALDIHPRAVQHKARRGEFGGAPGHDRRPGGVLELRGGVRGHARLALGSRVHQPMNQPGEQRRFPAAVAA